MPFRTFCSLFVVAGVFLLTAAFAAKANADVLVYFNFEDGTLNSTVDFQSDVVGAPDFNPGGGILGPVTLETNLTTYASVAGTSVNRTSGDIDITNNLAMGMRTTPPDNGSYIQFHADTTAFSNMSLSFAIDTQGNGFDMVAFSYSTDGGTTFSDPVSQPITSGGGFNTITFTVPVGAEGQPDVIFRLTFDGGKSQGQDLQTVIDNIQLTGVPEPATVAGGLLGVLGLCWHQRRRLRSLVPRLRRA